jgi:hypothetical protein
VVKYAVDPDPLANVPPLQLAVSLQFPPVTDVHVPSAAQIDSATQTTRNKKTVLVFMPHHPFHTSRYKKPKYQV